MKRHHTILTGATGTLGLELLPRLVRDDPGQRISVLLRGENEAAVRHRFARILRYIRTYWPGLDLTHVHPLRGDVTDPRLGLLCARYRSLRHQVTRIIHSAALTKLDPPLAAARRTNVGGTARLLEFAAGCLHLERFAHVSTAFVAGDRQGIVVETELLQGQEFLNTYQRSKCEAEVLVRSRMNELPVTVFRPGIIMGDSTDGHIAALDNIYLPLARIALGQLREIPGPGAVPLDIVPVDYVAEAISRLLGSERSIGQTYHLTAGAGNTTEARDLVEAAIRHAGRDVHRRPLFTEDLPATTRTAKRIAEVDPARTRFGVFFAHMNQRQTFDDANARRDLGDLAARRPRPARYLPRVFAFCRDTEWGRLLEVRSPRLATIGEEYNATAPRMEMADTSLDTGRAGLCHTGGH